MVGFVLFTSVFVFPLLLQRVLGYTAYETGITLLPASLLSLLIMPVVGKRLQAGTSPKVFIVIGFAMLMTFGIMMSKADINATKMFFALPLLIRGGGLALLMVPLTTQAVQGLKQKDMAQGIALNNMMRQLGGSFGIAIINNYIAQRYVVHRTDLVSNVYQGSLQLAERTAVMMQGLQSKLVVTGNIQNQINGLLDLAVVKQAYLITYLDAFMFSAICVLVAFPLILFTGSGKGTSKEKHEVIEDLH